MMKPREPGRAGGDGRGHRGFEAPIRAPREMAGR